MSARVLVVDDSLTVRTDLQHSLDAAGFVTHACGSAAEAREALARERYQLVILDIVLPDANGTDLLREIKTSERTADIPVMILSSETEVGDRIRGLAVGAVEYVGKPYDRAYVIDRANELLPGAAGAESSTMPRILVIDDSATSRELLRGALEGAGYEVHCAETGEEGLRLAARVRPAAAVVDGQLPGIDGATVVRRLRSDAALQSTPCLLLTASEGDAYEFEALEAGADGFIRKGADVALLLARLAAVLRSSNAVFVASREKSLLRTKKILAVDDSLTYLTAIAEPLRQDGHDVITAQSGEQALALLQIQSIDCILLDLVMPGLSGQETCRRIKRAPLWRAIPLLMLTAKEDREAMLESFDAGADDFIAKSSELGVLKARMRAQLRRKQFEDENRRIREELVRTELEAAEARANRELAEERGRLLVELRRANEELETFSYSVSHDLRAPLRSIAGFSRELLEQSGGRLDEQGKDSLGRVIAATGRMEKLIEGLLTLSKLSRAAPRTQSVDLSQLAGEIAQELQRREPGRAVEFVIAQGLVADCDPDLIRVVIQNLLENAWKYSSKQDRARIEFAAERSGDRRSFVLRDNGAGFDASKAERLFTPFQRFHSEREFEGTGIGLATVSRIVRRHGGEIWAKASPGRGAAFHFTLERDLRAEAP